MAKNMNEQSTLEPYGMNRRALINRFMIGGVCLAATGPLLTSCAPAAPVSASGGASGTAPLQLPLALTPDLFQHTGISVPDVLEAGTFYSRVFGGDNVNGEQEPFLRYFIEFNPGSVAIGKLGTLGSTGKTEPLIDHICVDAKPYDEAAWRARLAEEGMPYIASGVFLGVDNIPIQVAGAEEGESLSAGEITPMPVLYDGPALVATNGFDHIMMLVSDVEVATAFWQRIFGATVVSRSDGIVWLGNGGTVRLGLREAAAGEEFGADYQAVRARYDPEQARQGLSELGAQILPNLAYDPADGIRFIGPDGIETALVPV